MISLKSIVLSLALLAVAIVLNVDSQKTRANSYQQQQISSSNRESNSVYGGYNQSPVQRQPAIQQQSYSSPAKQGRPQQQPQQQQVSSYAQNRPARPVQQPQQPVYTQQQEQQPEGSAASSSYESNQSEADAEPASYGSVNGQPGTDFPAYTQVPKTNFKCEGLPYDYGMYADEETGCQAYHVCYNGRKDSFLCGVGTVFNQRILHCDYWYSVDCGKSSQYYGSNAYMGSSQPEPVVEAGVFPPAVRDAQGSQQSYSRAQSPSNNRPRNQQSSSPAAASSSSYNRNTQQQQVQEDSY